MPNSHYLPTKPSHFITGKTRVMFLLFALVLLIAVGSYLYLLQKANSLKSQGSQTPPKTSQKVGKPAMQGPKEFVDENIGFFYPDVLVVGEQSDESVTWNTMVGGTIATNKAMELLRQDAPFDPPTNIYNDGKYFNVDDILGRDMNDLEVMEYTVNCGLGCSYRIDQFKAGDVYYQLSFLTAGPGLSSRAEMILATLRKLTPTPTISTIKTTPPPAGGQKACTMEAKLCSDGSSVGRSGPNCEFAACPGQ